MVPAPVASSTAPASPSAPTATSPWLTSRPTALQSESGSGRRQAPRTHRPAEPVVYDLSDWSAVKRDKLDQPSCAGQGIELVWSDEDSVCIAGRFESEMDTLIDELDSEPEPNAVGTTRPTAVDPRGRGCTSRPSRLCRERLPVRPGTVQPPPAPRSPSHGSVRDPTTRSSSPCARCWPTIPNSWPRSCRSTRRRQAEAASPGQPPGDPTHGRPDDDGVGAEVTSRTSPTSPASCRRGVLTGGPASTTIWPGPRPTAVMRAGGGDVGGRPTA